MLRDDDFRRFLFLIDANLFHLGRTQGLRNELSDIVAPLDNIHLFATKLVHNLADS